MPRSNLSRILTDDERTAPPELYVEPKWYACFTRARAEKRVNGVLEQRGFETYLPLVPRERQWKDRRKIVDFPLFPSYVFARMTLKELHTILTTPGVSTVVRARGYPTPILDAEIENIQRFVLSLGETGLEPDPVPYFSEGQWVRVKDGPFKGVEGVVVERRGRRRLLVGLETIGQGFEVDFDASLLEGIKRGS